MAPSSFTLSFRCLIFCLQLHLGLSAVSDANPSQSPRDAFNSDSINMSSRIFNSIHDSMRQLGSSVNYESRCAFLATIPAGVHLYHGTSQEVSPVAGLKWLAFEPEHAMMFSYPAEHWSTVFVEGKEKEPEKHSAPHVHSLDTDHGQAPVDNVLSGSNLPLHAEVPLDDLLSHQNHAPDMASPPESPPSLWTEFKNLDGWGYLHTYSTTLPLRLLYLDGTSAAKTTLGTLDFQDRIILQDRLDLGTNLDDDDIRAAELCRVAHEDWGRRVDGFLRMETGFEIIMCELEDAGLEVRGTVATQKIRDAFATYKALAQRFNGIGRGRVTLDYDRFVTIHGDDLEHEATRAARRADIDALVMADGPGIDEYQKRHVDWQGVTDMIIERFASPLRLLSSDDEVWESKEVFNDEARRLMLPFVDHRNRSRRAEVDRCTSYFQPGTSVASTDGGLAASAILDILQTICYAFLAANEDDENVQAATSRMRGLVEKLNWSSWKECMPGCLGREICYVPVWPFSLALDMRRAPACVDEGGFYRVAVEEMMASTLAAKAQIKAQRMS